MIRIAGIFSLVGRLLSKYRILRIIGSILFWFLLLAVIIMVIFSLRLTDAKLREEIFNNYLPLLIVPMIFILIGFSSYWISPYDIEINLDELRKERIEINAKIESENELNIFHTIQLSLNQLNEYYTINKGQARVSFRFSIFSIVIGFITILLGIWLNYFGKLTVELSYISGISGVILEFIGGAYFFMYKKSLEQVNFFFGQLIKIQDTMLAINLADKISDEPTKIKMRENIITSLLERSLK